MPKLSEISEKVRRRILKDLRTDPKELAKHYGDC